MGTSKILFPNLSYKITGILFSVHNKLGRFCTERQYCDFLEQKLKENNINYVREKNINNNINGDRIDFCIEDKIIIECKAKKFITKEDYLSVQRYLQNSDKKLAMIVNFRHTYLKPKRIVKIEKI
jgi:GxxExxY protein